MKLENGHLSMERGQHRLSDVFHHQGKETIHPASKHPSSLAKWHSRSKWPNICLSIVAFSWFAFSNTRLENADVNRPKATKKDTPGPGWWGYYLSDEFERNLGGATWGHYQSWNGCLFALVFFTSSFCIKKNWVGTWIIFKAWSLSH